MYKIMLVCFLSIILSLGNVPAIVFAEEYAITDNGSGSTSEIQVESSSQTTVTQGNDANVDNNIAGDLNTGSNQANDNSGSDTLINTGNVSGEANIDTSVNSNSATATDCCAIGTGDVNISGNGAGSTTNVSVNQNRTVESFDHNQSDINNNVSIHGNSGDNTTSGTTGGTSRIATGDVNTSVTINNKTNSNEVEVDCDCVTPTPTTTPSPSTTPTPTPSPTPTTSVEGTTSSGTSSSSSNPITEAASEAGRVLGAAFAALPDTGVSLGVLLTLFGMLFLGVFLRWYSMPKGSIDKLRLIMLWYLHGYQYESHRTS